MKKSLLLFATILFAATQTLHAMHPSKKFFIRCYDKTFQVNKKTMKQFKTFKAQQNFERHQGKEEIGSEKNPWDITKYVKDFFGRAEEINKLKRKFNLALSFERISKEKKDKLLKQIEKNLNTKGIEVIRDQAGNPLDFENVPPSREKQIKFVKKFLEIANGTLDPKNERNLKALFLLVALAKELQNEFVQKKCTAELLRKMNLPINPDPNFIKISLIKAIEAQSKMPGLYPMTEEKFLFRKSNGKLDLYKHGKENTLEKLKTFEKEIAFFAVTPTGNNEFLSGNYQYIYLWNTEKPQPIKYIESKKKWIIIAGRPTRIVYSPKMDQFALLGGNGYDYLFFDKKKMKKVDNLNPRDINPGGNYIPGTKKFLLPAKKKTYLYNISNLSANIKDDTIEKIFEKTGEFITPIPNTKLFLSIKPYSNLIQLWNLDKTKPIAKFEAPEKSNVNEIAVINENFFCSLAHRSKSILIWDINQPEKPVEKITHPAPVQAMAVMIGGNHLLSYAKKNIYIWSLETAKLSFDQVELLFRVLHLEREAAIEKGGNDNETFKSLPEHLQREIKKKMGKK